MQIQRPKGTYDLIPGDAFQRTYLENTIRNIFDLHNYKEVRTPTFEYTRLFKRSIGEETDIVSKEMYTFNEEEFTLKPEMTAPTIRAYISNSLYNESPLQKLYYISNMFRRERPQAGRFREFSQFGAESIGSSDFTSDAEMIMMADSILKSLGLRDYRIRINTIGNPGERKKFVLALKEYLEPHVNELSGDSRKRLEKNPLRILDTKDERDIELLNDAPRLGDYLEAATMDHFERILDVLRKAGMNLLIDDKLVRGFDYYTSTTFEFVSDALGAQNSLLGGGRYDLLVEQLGGKPTPAIGFAAGFERLEIALKAEGKALPGSEPPKAYICIAGEIAKPVVLGMVSYLRNSGIKCDTDLLSRSLKSQMKEADRMKAKYVVVVGESEIGADRFRLRKMSDGTETEVSGVENIKKVLLYED